MPLAQFFTEAFSAAEGTGAAAILPYKYIPYAYTYNAAFYEFGINTDAGTYAVSAMVKHQADRVRATLVWCTPLTQPRELDRQQEAAEAAGQWSALQRGRHQHTSPPCPTAQLPCHKVVVQCAHVAVLPEQAHCSGCRGVSGFACIRSAQESLHPCHHLCACCCSEVLTCTTHAKQTLCKLLLALSTSRGADHSLRGRQVPEAHGAVPVLRHAGAGVQPQLPAAGEHPCRHAVAQASAAGSPRTLIFKTLQA